MRLQFTHLDHRFQSSNKLTGSPDEIDGSTVIPALTQFTKEGKIKPTHLGINDEWVKVRTSYYTGTFSFRLEFRCTFAIGNMLYDKKVIYDPMS